MLDNVMNVHCQVGDLVIVDMLAEPLRDVFHDSLAESPLLWILVTDYVSERSVHLGDGLTLLSSHHKEFDMSDEPLVGECPRSCREPHG